MYNRRSLQNPARPAPSTATTASDASASIDDDDGLDMGGADMFNRNSVAIFERLNKEQVKFSYDLGSAMFFCVFVCVFGVNDGYCWP